MHWLIVVSCLTLVLAGCGRAERMEKLYAERCFGCHGPSGKGDGPLAASLPVRVPDFRDTIRDKNVAQIRRIIKEGNGFMPAFSPALTGSEIQDLVVMTRLLSQKDRPLKWWERFGPAVWAHCSVPWEFVFGYDQSAEEAKKR